MRFPRLGSSCTQSPMGGPGPIYLLTSSHSGQSGGKAKRLPVQENHSHCTMVTQHALVLGSSGHVKTDRCVPTQSANSAIQSDFTQEFVKPKSTCLAPRTSVIREQGFSEAEADKLRLLKESQPDQSMRKSGPSLQSGSTVIRWTSGHSPIKSLAKFLLYLFQGRKLQPSSIDGYRSAIADKLGNMPIYVSRDENLTSWIVSKETVLRVAEASPLETILWYFTSSQSLPVNPLRRPP